MDRLDIKAKVKMKHKRKSQITMLMIIGLVLFIIVGLVLYLSKSAIKKQSQQTTKSSEEATAEEQPIKELVANCLDKLAKDAVVLLGKQAGHIYRSQYGLSIDNLETREGTFFVKHQGYDVAYNLIPARFSILPYYYSYVPDYPWLTFPYATFDSSEEIFEGHFGISENILPSLDSSPYSIKNQIEAFIDNKMPGCANFNFFREQGYGIEMGESKTQVTIGSKDVSIKSKIPLKITNIAANKNLEIEDFSTNLNVRLNDVYFFVKNLIKKDITNIKFDIGDLQNNYDAIEVQLIKDVYSSGNIKADVVIVRDKNSLVYGKPFEYVFARRNRAPAIYYIKNNDLEFEQGHEISQEDLLSSSELKAEDPDEDRYTFTITPSLPKVLNEPQINFKVEVNDGRLSDYQIITVNKI